VIEVLKAAKTKVGARDNDKANFKINQVPTAYFILSKKKIVFIFASVYGSLIFLIKIRLSLGILLKNLEFWLYILPSSIKRYVESIGVLEISVAAKRLFSAIFVETSFGMFCAFTQSILRKRPNVNVDFFIFSLIILIFL